MVVRPLGRLVAGLVSVVLLVGATQPPAGTLVEPWIDTTNRDAVAVAWQLERGRDVPDMEWTGSYGQCRAGEASRDLALATVARANFYRAMAGVPATITLNDAYSDKAQHAALTMSATGRLSHSPDPSFACLDDTGREAAASSNLYLGRIGPAAIDGYIEDPGAGNADVGHRNTILHPPTTSMGVGHVAGSPDLYPANALWVFDGGVFDENPPLREPGGFVAWPPRGHVPAELVHPRWSFGLAGADFERATVTMTVDGRAVGLEVVTRHSLAGYVPSPILVWEPEADAWPELVGGRWPGGLDTDRHVEVTVGAVGIDGRSVDFRYRVSVMAPAGSGAPIGLATLGDAFGAAMGVAGRTAQVLADAGTAQLG